MRFTVTPTKPRKATAVERDALRAAYLALRGCRAETITEAERRRVLGLLDAILGPGKRPEGK